MSTITKAKAKLILEETEEFYQSNKEPNRRKDYKLFLKKFISIYLDLQNILKEHHNDVILKYKVEYMLNVRLKKLVEKNLKFLEDNPDTGYIQFLSSNYEFARTLKIIYIIYILNIKWLISHPIVQIIISHYRTLHKSTFKSYLISPFVYIFYGFFAICGSELIRDPVVRNLCMFYSVFITVPIIIARAYCFVYPENMTSAYSTGSLGLPGPGPLPEPSTEAPDGYDYSDNYGNSDYRVVLLNTAFLIWFLSYLLQELTDFINESSIFKREDNQGGIALNIATNFNFSFLNKRCRILKMTQNISRAGSFIRRKSLPNLGKSEGENCDHDATDDDDEPLPKQVDQDQDDKASVDTYWDYLPTPSPDKLAQLKSDLNDRRATEISQKFNPETRFSNRKYFRSYWTKVDLSILFFMAAYFICSIVETTSSLEISIICFYGFTVLIIFRLFEYTTPIIPGLGPFINPFLSMWKDIFLFLVIVAILAMANSLGLSIVLCQDPLNEDKYSECVTNIFWFLFLQPLGTAGQLLGSGEVYAQQYDDFIDNMKNYSQQLQHVVILVITIYYISTAFCLLRGMIVKFVVSSKEEANRKAHYNNTRNKLSILFCEIDTSYPIPWNFVWFLILLIESVVRRLYKLCVKRKENQGQDHDHDDFNRKLSQETQQTDLDQNYYGNCPITTSTTQLGKVVKTGRFTSIVVEVGAKYVRNSARHNSSSVDEVQI